MANTFNAITTGTGGIATTGDSTGAIAFQKDGTTNMTIDSSGNVTLAAGTALVPLTKSWYCYTSNYGMGTPDSLGLQVFAGTDAIRFGQRTGGTTFSEQMRITPNGGVSFGSSGTAYGTSGQILQSNGDAAPTWVNSGSQTLIASGSLSGTTTTISSLPQTYRDLKVYIKGESSAAASLSFNVNAVGAVQISSTATNTGIVMVYEYANTTNNKQMLASVGNQTTSATFATTAAITSVSIVQGNGQAMSGAYEVYGVK